MITTHCTWQGCLFPAAHPQKSGPHQWANLCELHHTHLQEILRRGRGRKMQAAARLAKANGNPNAETKTHQP